jgi:predicted nucleic acid-binding protein
VSNTFNILSMDGPGFRRWAQLMHRQSDTLYEVGMIAAIAKVHQLTVVTQNVGDFNPFEVPLLNPFTSRAELGRSDKPTGLVRQATHQRDQQAR